MTIEHARRDLLEMIEGLADFFRGEREDAIDLVAAIEALIDAKLAPPGILPQWIPVTERVPSPEVYVLCWDGKETFIEWFGGKPDAGRGVTHWIPYPMPPGARSAMHDGSRS